MTRLYEEVAFLAYYFHWSQDQILALEHARRRQWIDELAKINRRINDREIV
nr:DUF6760 family protein [Nevskia sp.]